MAQSPREAGHAASAPSASPHPAAMSVRLDTGATSDASAPGPRLTRATSATGIHKSVPSASAEPRQGTPEVVTGIASWWASFGPGIYAALPGYVAGTRVWIRVWSGSLHVDARVITSCGCFVGTPDERIVDLSPGMLRALGLDKARGLYQVTVEVLR
jgi:hypothetical protein